MWYWLITRSAPGRLGRLVGRLFLLVFYVLVLYYFFAGLR